MKTLKIEAKREKLDEVLAFLEDFLDGLDCDMKSRIHLAVAVEEIYINIASYAYPDSEGNAEINLDYDEEEHFVIAVFKDSGIPYDPLAKEDPDVSLPAEERQIGGLGIFMVKKSMDNVTYEYSDGKNILTIYKRIS